MVSLSGARVPTYMDAAPLPGLGLGGESEREYVIGILRSGWMIFDGEWKLARYGGGSHLFNLRQDPGEQHNVADSNRDRVRELTLLAQRHVKQVKPGPPQR